MAQIDKPNLHFNTNLHTGTGYSQNITTGLNMSNNGGMVWNKLRSGSNNHVLWDTIRTATKTIYPDLTAQEATEATSLTAFTTTGWTGGGGGNTNANGSTYVSWNWLAGSSHSGSSNSDGSITSTVSANTVAGFSIVSYTGNGSGGATVGHGLSSVPHMYIIKRRDAGGSNWHVYHQGIGATKGLRLNLSNAESTTDIWQDTAPTSSVFSLGSSIDVNASGGTYIGYIFSEKKGYSKFGSYTGNGNADGTFVYTGFKPAWFLFKQTNESRSWFIWDNKRDSDGNPMEEFLSPNNSNAESGSGNDYADFTSSGIKMRENNAGFNKSGATYIYMAFAENPIVGSNNIPTTAK